MSLLLPPLAALAAVFWAYFKVLRIAKQKNLVDNPDARKLQKTPIPVLGGIAVFIGILCGMGVAGCLCDLHGLLPVLLMMAAMLYVGALDDLTGLTPRSRLVAEILVVLMMIYGTGLCIDNFHSLWGIHQISWLWAVPLTVFAGVGIINAINMVDGVNGLSSGLCITTSIMFGVTFLRLGQEPNAILAFTMAAALFPFLLHNVFGRSSRMFIGDAGTMVMGTMLTWFVIALLATNPDNQSSIINHQSTGTTNMQNDIGYIALVVSILVVPVFDTLRVMTARMKNGKSPFSPDKTHLHHAFIGAGVSHSITALSEILIGIIIYFVGYAAHHLGYGPDVQLYAVILAGILLVWGSYVALIRLGKKEGFRRLTAHTHFGHSPWWLRLQSLLDAREFTKEEVDPEHLQDRQDRKFNN